MKKRYEAQMFVAYLAACEGLLFSPTRGGNMRIYAPDRAVTVAEVSEKVFFGGSKYYPLKKWTGQVVVDLSRFPGPGARV